MEIIKRNGKKVSFNSQRIVLAIVSAMNETEKGVDKKLSVSIADEIAMEISKYTTPPHVEEIQDAVEYKLSKNDRYDVARAYAIYREDRAKKRVSKPKSNGLLTDEFISNYKHKKPPFTDLGHFVYLRTYSRYIAEENRREYWWETVRRAVEYNCSLSPNTTKEEAEMLYDNVFNLRQFLSGRTLFTGGTEVSKKYGMSNYNCFREDTEFLTDGGIKTFADFQDGDIVNVLNGYGSWSPANVRNYGRDKLVKLVVNKDRETKEIYTTANHLWFVHDFKKSQWKKVKTTDLKVGERLRMKRRYEHTTSGICNVGIQHGIVFGDGTFDKELDNCKVELIGEKQELAKYFNTGTIINTSKDSSIIIEKLPYNWKELPPITADIEYLKGFLIGLLAIDGSVLKSNSLSISNADLETMKFIRSICELNGITTSQIQDRGHVSNCKTDRKLHQITLNTGTFNSDVLISTKHLERFNEGDVKEWEVKEIVETDTVEDVWCVEEPKTNSFTLSGGLHTHNCSFGVANEFEIFEDMFYLLLIGAGVGLGCKKKDVEQLPSVRTNLKIVHKAYVYTPKVDRTEYTGLEFEDSIVEIVVGDSKEAWCQALGYFLKMFYSKQFNKIETIIVNYDNIRPKGERLATFGGYASGYESMMSMFEGIGKVFNKGEGKRKKLKPIDCLDIANIIGQNVVSGGVRRTSEVILFDPDDIEVYTAKSNLYKQIGGEWIIDSEIAHRRMSNNSIQYDKKPSREQWNRHIQEMRFSGEPAFQNLESAKKRREDAEGGNPCMEILLRNRGMCNLTELNVMGFVETGDGTLNYEALHKAQRLSARAGYRMACIEFELYKWDKVNKEDMLLGCGLTGWQDMVNAVNMSTEEEIELMKSLRKVAHDSANEVAEQMGKNRPKLYTTIKPSGTLSQLPTVSNGVHFSHSPYYIRRVRINAHDPLVKVVEELGYIIYPEVGQTWENCDTVVIEFPVKSPKGRTKYEASAIEQLEIYKRFMKYYVDHNCSITVHVRPNEWDMVEEWCYENWDDVIAISFLALDDSFYQLMPYEAISEDEYVERVSKMKEFKPSLLKKYEKQETDLLESIDNDCVSGSCPIR